ncbi:hypothetical protein SARC_14506 [Sphaeroforma arctica JP610]|uniref:Fatty acid desaturase domain-containing protein n=1 Tax=Sphaeroforma arctica JP610 TaxID=667725 RepID=A0A0L0F9Z2_9EUKA|nr:hypothetical protein SARC_14506 [Sphaeroforma arctica JP610]KNC72933.1 hypothetical protein SARC_14506 [Sphaeroforma arctica JP610]|eukprot:XP_014146835.1 hypothetical protein SARC_14506 [Sphaeroforma arctica JP610]
MAALEPYLIFTPSVLRYYVHHFASVYIQLLAGILMYIEQAKYFIRLCMGLATFKLTHLIVYAEIPVLVYLSGSVSAGVWLWAVIQATASWVFINLSFVITTHHHDEIWHQGDTTISGDFGLLQAEATRDRLECVHSPFAMYMFGDHVLHHLFPCVDHGYLEVLYPVLLQTLEEFGVEATLLRYSMWESVKGFARQTVREYEHHISTIARRSKVE